MKMASKRKVMSLTAQSESSATNISDDDDEQKTVRDRKKKYFCKEKKVTSKKKKPIVRRRMESVGRPDLFTDENLTSADESFHDPFSDTDGEFDSDKNYDPTNVQDSDTSDSTYEIFSVNKHRRRMKSTRISESSNQSSQSTEDSSTDKDESCDRSVIENSTEDVNIKIGPTANRLNIASMSSYLHHKNKNPVLSKHSDEVAINDVQESQNKVLDRQNQVPASSSEQIIDSPQLLQQQNVSESQNNVLNIQYQDSGSLSGQNTDSPQLLQQQDIPEFLNEVSAILIVQNRVGSIEQNTVTPNLLPNHNTENIFTNLPPLTDEEWQHNVTEIPNFNFDDTLPGIRVPINETTSEKDIFDLLFTPELVEYLVNCTNVYGTNLVNQNRPHTRNSRYRVFHETNAEEMYKFLGLSLLSGQIRLPENRKLFSLTDPLYYHPVFKHVMTGRRYEQILRCICASDLNAKGSNKITGFIDILTRNFRQVYYPEKELSLDESLMLFRGRLIFRTYMKNKKTKYGIKFYVLASHDGYVLNQKMYCGKDMDESAIAGKTIEKLVLRLTEPYVLKGHELYMDNFYNSVSLSEKLLNLRTHTCGTLRSNRKGNPTFIAKKKLKKGEYCWLRKNHVYVTNWRDKRQVLMLTTIDQPEMVEVSNRHGQKRNKPKEVARYNRFMSGIDRADQMISYYSCPRKTLRWYKKVLFHMLDVATWNSFYLYKKYVVKNKKRYAFADYRDMLIKRLLKLDNNVSGKDTVSVSADTSKRYTKKVPEQASMDQSTNVGHWPVRIPARENSKKKYSFLNCRVCINQEPKKRRETSYRCNGCPNTPPLCPECFEKWHAN